MKTISVDLARCATCGHRAEEGDYMVWDQIEDEAICMGCIERWNSYPQTARDRGVARQRDTVRVENKEYQS